MSYQLRILRKKVPFPGGTDNIACGVESFPLYTNVTEDTLQYRVYQQIVPELETGNHLTPPLFGWSEWKDVEVLEDIDLKDQPEKQPEQFSTRGFIKLEDELPPENVELLLGWMDTRNTSFAKYNGGRFFWNDESFKTPDYWMLSPKPPVVEG